MKSKIDAGALVYSTGIGRICPGCRRPIADCVCKLKRTVAAPDTVVRVSRETKGRNGKNVTVIRGLALSPGELAELGKQLKTSCGSGGTVKDGIIEVQGDHCARVMDTLGKLGWTVKRAGG